MAKSARKNKKNKKRKLRKVRSKSKTSYTSGTLEAALKAISEGISFRKAAKTFGVPQTTIFRHCKNPDILSKKGPSTVLSEKEESDIVAWIKYRAERGFPVDKDELLDTVQAYVESLKKKTVFKDNRPGRHWYESFYKRHPDLRERVPQHLTKVRADVSEADLREWFQEIKLYLERKGLLNISPSRIFNCDETNIHLCPKSGKVITTRGARTVYKIVDALEKESVTALFTYSADGTRAPPMILYKYAEGIPLSVIQHVPAGWGIGNSDTGWMTTETFYEYMTNVFHPWLLKKNIEFPVLLYLDGHSSHLTMPLVKFCRNNGIELLSLFPHSTHVLQPLDVAFFHAFKDVWKKTVPLWKKTTNTTRLSKNQFAAVLLQALESMNEEKIIKNGFRTCGLVPFDPDSVQYDVLNKKKKSVTNSTANQTLENQTPQSSQINNSDFDVRDSEDFLSRFESFLSVDLLEEFKASEATGTWTKDVENQGLFNFWLQRKTNDNAMRGKPRIKNIETLPCKIVLLPQDHEQTDKTDKNVENYPLEVNAENESCILLEVPADINLDLLKEQDIIIAPDSLDDISNLNVQQNVRINSIENNNDSLQSLNETNDGPVSDENINCCTTIAVPSATESISDTHKQVDGKENLPSGEGIQNRTNVLNQFLTLPEQYLPKKKREKLKSTGKKRVPAVGTSDEWYNIHLQKENEKKLKEEKLAAKKKLQEEKKLLANKKRELELQMQEIQKKIKQEKL